MLNENEKEKLEKDLKDPLDTMTKEFLQAQVIQSAVLSDLKELSLIRQIMSTPEGGQYLWSFIHLGGPKINLEKIREDHEPGTEEGNEHRQDDQDNDKLDSSEAEPSNQ